MQYLKIIDRKKFKGFCPTVIAIIMQSLVVTDGTVRHALDLVQIPLEGLKIAIHASGEKRRENMREK